MPQPNDRATRSRSSTPAATSSPRFASTATARASWNFALAKAQASAAWGGTTAQLADGAKSTPGFERAPHVVTVAGGIPIWSADGRTRLGAVGASGEAPADDAACAVAGIAAAGLRSERAR